MNVFPSIQATAPNCAGWWKYLPQSGCDDLTPGCFFTSLSIIPRKVLGSSLELAATSGPGMPVHLQVLFVADQDVNVLHDAPDNGLGAFRPPQMFQSLAR